MTEQEEKRELHAFLSVHYGLLNKISSILFNTMILLNKIVIFAV